MIKIRLQGLPEDNAGAVALLGEAFDILDDSGNRAPRGTTRLRFRYLTARPKDTGRSEAAVLRSALAEARDRIAVLSGRGDLARQLADKADELAALRAEFEAFADTCASHCADRLVEQVAAEDVLAHRERLLAQLDHLTAILTAYRRCEGALTHRRVAHAPGQCPTPCDPDCRDECHELHQLVFTAGPTAVEQAQETPR